MDMEVKTKPIDEATPEELRIYAQINLGLEIEGNESRNVVLGKMKRAGMEPKTIAIYEQAQPVTRSDMALDNVKVQGGQKFFKINVAALPGEGGDMPVYLRVNGVVFLVTRGLDVWVPEKYVESLRNAVQDEYDPTFNGIGDPRPTLAYPFSHVA